MAVNDLKDGGFEVDAALDRDLSLQLQLIEKHFSELGLFSRDEVRRRSVQMSLSQRYGDLHTLELMRRIKEGDFGVKDEGIVRAFAELRARLMRESVSTFDPAAWTGRPSGGAF